MRHARPTILLATVMLLSGCASATAVTRPSTPPSPSGLVVATGHGWTSAGLDGPMPAPGSCHMRAAADGQPLPDPRCTPGAVDSAVTDANITSTVCRKGGYTSSVRPPENLTQPAKRRLLAAYGIPAADIGKYELDHLVDLAAGGASSISDLWPEPDMFQHFKPSAFVHNEKDAIEAYLFHAVCAGKVKVSSVQRYMAADWTTAVARLGLPAIPANYTG